MTRIITKILILIIFTISLNYFVPKTTFSITSCSANPVPNQAQAGTTIPVTIQNTNLNFTYRFRLVSDPGFHEVASEEATATHSTGNTLTITLTIPSYISGPHAFFVEDIGFGGVNANSPTTCNNGNGLINIVGSSVNIQPPKLPISPTGNFTATGLVGQIISAFLPIILGIAGFVTVIIIVISGIQFVTSGGNPEAAAAARGRLTFAIIGFVIIVLAFAILQIIDKIFLGTNIT